MIYRVDFIKGFHTIRQIERNNITNLIGGPGKSAYQIAQSYGFQGSEEEWLDAVEKPWLEDAVAQLDRRTDSFRGEVDRVTQRVYLPCYNVVEFSPTDGVLLISGMKTAVSTTYRRTSLTNSAAMLTIDHTKTYTYTGQIDNSSYCGVVYTDAAMKPVGYEITVGLHDHLTLVPPANAVYAGFCGLGGFTIHYMELLDRLATKLELASIDAVINEDVFTTISLSTTAGEIKKSGLGGSLSTYLRTTTTNNVVPYMLHIDHLKSYLYTGEIDHNDYCGVFYRDAAMLPAGYEKTKGLYDRSPLTPPSNAAYAGFCGKGGFTVEMVEHLGKVATKSDLKVMEQSIIEESFTQIHLGTAVGEIKKSGLTGSTVGYIHTSTTNNASTHMLSIDRSKRYLYTGEIDSNDYCGVFYRDEAMQPAGYEMLTGSYSRAQLTPPAAAVYAGFCGNGGFTIEQVDSKLRLELLPSQQAETASGQTIWVDCTASQEGNGSMNAPLKSLRNAVEQLALTKQGTIIVAKGDYRETLPLHLLGSGRFSIYAREGHRVRILGSDQLVGWTKTPGYANVYQIPFTGSVPVWGRYADPIFEDGRPSQPIDPALYHPLQKNLGYRLPFTPIFKKTTAAQVEAAPGSYCIVDSVMYIHTSESSDPATNGFCYENIVRGWNSCNSAVSQKNMVELNLHGLQFFFGTGGVDCRGFARMERRNCVALGTNGAGAFCNNTGYIQTWYEEAGFCNNDGENSHFSAYVGYDTLTDNRSMSPTVIHNYLWTHDNGDDGESSHENHNVSLKGCLHEFNGDSGCRPSNDATYMVDGCTFRDNGWEVGIGLTRGGEGFATVNPVTNPNRKGCRAWLYGCLSERNNIGFATISQQSNLMELRCCTSRNNLSAELYAGQGHIVVRDSRATNSDPSKIKVVASGSIEVINTTVLA